MRDRRGWLQFTRPAFELRFFGHVEAGDPIFVLTRDPHRFGVTELARLYARDRDDVESMRRAAELDVLPDSWRDFFRKRVSTLAA